MEMEMKSYKGRGSGLTCTSAIRDFPPSDPLVRVQAGPEGKGGDLQLS